MNSRYFKDTILQIKKSVYRYIHSKYPLEIFLSFKGELFKAYLKSEKSENLRFLEIYCLVGELHKNVENLNMWMGVFKERKPKNLTMVKIRPYQGWGVLGMGAGILSE